MSYESGRFLMNFPLSTHSLGICVSAGKRFRVLFSPELLR